MKMSFVKTAVVLAAATTLSACASNWDIDGVSKMEAEKGYLAAAQKEYIAIAQSEYDESDYSDSAYFLEKARQATMGNHPIIQIVDEREVPPGTAPDLQAAYDELSKLAGPKAWQRAPGELARAQAQYDCWLQEQEEGFQQDHIKACRMGYETALAELKEILAKRVDLFVVLPHEDGSVGGIEIDDGKNKVVLDKALAAARTGDKPAKSFAIDKGEVDKIFGDALASQPIPPKSFTLYFKNNSTDLTEASKPEIVNVFQDIDRRKVAEVFVIGHTDRVGGLQTNDRLSLKRANAVLEYLVGRGIKRDMMQAAGRGEREPVIKTKNSVAEPKNRRVEISVR